MNTNEQVEVWVHCAGSHKYATSVATIPTYGYCAECGNGVALRKDRTTAKHDRPRGVTFSDGKRV